MQKVVMESAAIRKPPFARRKASEQPPNLESIIKKLEDFAACKRYSSLEISKEEINFCRTVKIPDRITRQKLVNLILSDKLKDEPISEVLASNENIVSDSDEAKEIFIRLTSEPYAVNRRPVRLRISSESDDGNVLYFGGEDDQALFPNVSAAQRGFCVNKKLIPVESCMKDSHLRERITDYIMQNSNNPLAVFLARNENLYLCEGMGGLKIWAKEFSSSEVYITSTTAKSILENLRLQQRKPSDGKLVGSKSPETGEPPEALVKIITRIKNAPKESDLSSKDKLILMSNSDYLIRMQDKEGEKFVFELMQNPNIVSRSSWVTAVNKAISYFESNSDHGFVLGLALNEQKNKIENFREGLLKQAIQYPYSQFAENVITGLTEFDGKNDLRLVSTLARFSPKIQARLKENKSYQTALRGLKRGAE